MDQKDGHQLKVLNSLTRKKDVLRPLNGKTIKWYSCGPTVYDVAHLGHARSYITFDIIRRILSDYFGYQIFYVMNITDIDDKIIKRARSTHLFNKFVGHFLEADTGAKNELLKQVVEAIENYATKAEIEKDAVKKDMMTGIVVASKQALENLKELVNASVNDQVQYSRNLTRLIDVVADHQDVKLGHTVIDHQIFKNLTQKYESEFHEDMKKLGVLPPNALTRVSEHIEETGQYLKQIESNGFAYRSDGSVYFDTNKFDSDPKHSYAKLVREAFGKKDCLDEGEGELSNKQQATKKSPNDFALWKKSKPGEPSWQTQDYEAGRPGWHIECSVMASHLLGECFDIHSGGCDLKFPHHDNEIAQAEAYYNTGKNWVNCFVHSGHLTISGCKMSKSLKNFITIREALQSYSARQLRFAFLAHSWAETLDYSPNTMSTAMSYEKTFNEFFLNVSDVLRRTDQLEYFAKWSVDDLQLNQEFESVPNKVHAALCDNFDTRTVLNVLSALVKETNKRKNVNPMLTKDIAQYVARILRVFGANFDEIVLDFDSDKKKAVGSSAETDTKFVEALAQFRADIRSVAKFDEAQQSIKNIMALCDSLRDVILPNLGVRLEDRQVDNNPYAIKFVDAETMAREKALNEKRECEKRLKEETAKLEKLKLQQQREEKMKIPPDQMFRTQVDKYSQFDDNGMPTHDAAGKEISKSALKKLLRLYDEQAERYKKYISK